MRAVPAVEQIDVFVNEDGDVSIMQKTGVGDDVVIWLPVQYVDPLVEALEQVRDEAKGSE